MCVNILFGVTFFKGFIVGEFDLIKRYFATHDQGQGVVLGVGDDGAILQPTADMQLVISADTLVAGRHFAFDANAFDIGWKSLAVNLSDLAAMGATPRWCLLALTLPDNNEDFIREFAKGFTQLLSESNCALVGGDTTKGPLAISVTVMGEVPLNQAITRSGAKVGDDIYVSGMVGDAGLGLAVLQNRETSDDSEYVLSRLHRPTPRLALGQALRGIAHSALDISDGLAQDLSHILERSNVGADLYADLLPLSDALKDRADAVTLALTSGDDYELCFTAPVHLRNEVLAAAEKAHVSVTRVGSITASQSLQIWQNDQPLKLERLGFQHF